MQIKLWGVRGSLPAPINNEEYNSKLSRILNLAVQKKLDSKDNIEGFIESLPDELHYITGGDTTCVTVLSDSGNIYILDCGTGIRRLGNDLMEGDCGKGKGNLNIMLTHNHWDHIQGLPFFRPIYVPNRERIYENEPVATVHLFYSGISFFELQESPLFHPKGNNRPPHSENSRNFSKTR